MVEANGHQNVDWLSYFKSIRRECPWSLRAFQRGQIEFTHYTGEIWPLGELEARIYIIEEDTESIEALAAGLDYGQDAWLFSYPGYGPFAAPVAILIQQNRQRLEELRTQLELPGAAGQNTQQ